MKKSFILLILLIVSKPAGADYYMQIRDLIVEQCSERVWQNFIEIKDLIAEDLKLKMTDSELETNLLSIAKEEYDIFKKDTTKYSTFLHCITILLSTHKSKNTDDFIKEIYQTGDVELKITTLKYMLFQSDQWFQCSKDIIDIIGVKYGANIRIPFYRYLIKRYHATPENAPEIDSLKYLMYRALEHENWSYVAELDSLYAKIEPGYVKSKQRLMILTKVDNKQVMELLKKRRDKYKKINSTTDLDIEMAYDAYLKLKKEKNLEDYSPPVLK